MVDLSSHMESLIYVICDNVEKLKDPLGRSAYDG